MQTIEHGSQTHRNSLFITEIPCPSKKRLIFSVDTSIGVDGKKYLSFVNGAKKAIPCPPLVNASRTPCEPIHKNKYAHT